MDTNGDTNEAMENFIEGDPLQPNGKIQEGEPKKTFSEKIKFIGRGITVEPIMIFVIMGSIMANLTSQNLGIEKACRVNLNFTDEVCTALKLQKVGSENPDEKSVQKLIAHFMSVKTYMTATIPSVIALFAGSYSDNTGKRKLFLLWALTGQCLLCINGMLNVYFFHELNLEFLTFSDATFESLSGSWSLPLSIMFAYISRITTEKDRTFRMGLLNFALTVGFPIGMGLSGYLIKNFGYYGGYSFALCVHVINLTYTAFILKVPTRSSDEKMHDGRGFCYNIRLFVSLSNIKDSFKVLVRNGPNHRRARVLISLVTICTLFGPLYGEAMLMYLITRYRFNWDEVTFSIFQSYNFVTHSVGTLFSLVVLSKYLGWHDSLLGTISIVSKIASSFVYCFAPNGRIFFIAPIVEILNGTSMLAIRSLLSKLVAPNELGKISSIISLMENFTPIIYIPLYTTVYKATMDVLPGAVFLMGSTLIFPALIVCVYFYYEHRKNLRRLQEDEVLENNNNEDN